MIKQLSYETLFNLKDMLNKQINREKKAVTLFNLNNAKLLKLQNDLKLLQEAIKTKESVTIPK